MPDYRLEAHTRTLAFYTMNRQDRDHFAPRFYLRRSRGLDRLANIAYHKIVICTAATAPMHSKPKRQESHGHKHQHQNAHRNDNARTRHVFVVTTKKESTGHLLTVTDIVQ
jgi:hypothetical protein